MGESLAHGLGLSIIFSSLSENRVCRTSSSLTTGRIGLLILARVSPFVSMSPALWDGISEHDETNREPVVP